MKTEKKNTGTIAFRFRQVLLYLALLIISALAESNVPLQHMISRMARTAHLHQTEDLSRHRMKQHIAEQDN